MKGWIKLGQIYNPLDRDRHPKLATHAANPLPVHIDGDVYRIFYSGRDECNRSSVGAVDFDISKMKITVEYEAPFFVHGSQGSFYSDGVSIGNVYEVQDRRYMLFMGWQLPPNQHWRGEIGRLELSADLTLEIQGQEPFIALNKSNPISLSYPWVIKNTRGEYDMWYGSTLNWDTGNGEMLHVIKHAKSSDGDEWKSDNFTLPHIIGLAQAFSRPTILRNKFGKYEMWFSYRGGNGQSYRIGYAKSHDGLRWGLALNECGIDVSNSGWDSQMIEYPFVFRHKDREFMLYNGNDYGRTGFGLALRER